MITFKQYIHEKTDQSAEEAFDTWENLLHHIAEEELISCKVNEMFFKKVGANTVIHFTADCNDKPRPKGHQPDLSRKVSARLKAHDFPGLGKVSGRVYHSDADPR